MKITHLSMITKLHTDFCFANISLSVKSRYFLKGN